jgi:outer membrane lipoprotein-sorting protein
MKTKRNRPLAPRCTRGVGITLSILCSLAIFAPAIPVRAQGKENPELQKIYRQMETVGKNLHTFYAKISEKKYTAILKEFDTPKTGDFYLARAKDGSTMMRRDISSPAREILTLKGEVATVYQPKIKQARIANLGKHTDKAAEFLAFGIGRPPADLQKNYDISYIGDESVGGSPCAMLSLKPKDPKMAAYYSLIVMWVQKSSGIPLQYKLQEAGTNDYLLETFSDEKLNINIPESKFEPNLPKDVEIQKF